MGSNDKILYEDTAKKVTFILFDDKFGKKIRLKFPYNPYIVKLIKATDWKITHRTFEPDSKNWTIDYSKESLNEVLGQVSEDVTSTTYISFIKGINSSFMEL